MGLGVRVETLCGITHVDYVRVCVCASVCTDFESGAMLTEPEPFKPYCIPYGFLLYVYDI